MTDFENDRTYVIAEAGVNHNGDAEIALSLVDAAAEAGSDSVKFQTFRPEELASRHAPKALYQTKSSDAEESQLEMLGRLTLDPDTHQRLIEHCSFRGIDFLSTPFDLSSLGLLTEQLGLRRVKIGSGDLTNAPLLLATAETGSDVILSTGMSTVEDVAVALGLLAFGFSDTREAPTTDGFRRAFEDPAARERLRKKVTLLHCTTAYPTPFDEVNLRAMDTLTEAFGLPVGLSDHTPGIEIAVAAAARGAGVIEKHLTLDRSLPGPDHSASIEPGEFSAMVAAIRNVEAALGDGLKSPTPSEQNNMHAARKSLVTATAIRRGDLFGTDNLTVKRPGSGVPAIAYWDWLGRVAERDYEPDEVIQG